MTGNHSASGCYLLVYNLRNMRVCGGGGGTWLALMTPEYRSSYCLPVSLSLGNSVNLVVAGRIPSTRTYLWLECVTGSSWQATVESGVEWWQQQVRTRNLPRRTLSAQPATVCSAVVLIWPGTSVRQSVSSRYRSSLGQFSVQHATDGYVAREALRCISVG